MARILAFRVTAGITTGAISTTTANADPALTELAEIKAYDGPVEGLSLSGDGRLIVTTSLQPELKLWSFDYARRKRHDSARRRTSYVADGAQQSRYHRTRQRRRRRL